MASHTCLPLTTSPASLAAPVAVTSPRQRSRFLFCLGVEPNVIPPRRPDLNPYVERFHRTLSQECLQLDRPATAHQVQEATEAFLIHYNEERPNQARSCGNHPPRVACSQFPTLPTVPQMVQPDHWLRRVHQRTFARTVQADGGVGIDRQEYYVGRALAGQSVTCVVQAASQHFDIWHGDSYITSLPIKGLHAVPALPFEEYVTLMKKKARSESVADIQ